MKLLKFLPGLLLAVSLFGQDALPPSVAGATGTASGDLSGSFPGPTVAKINGTTVATNSAADQVPLTTASAVTAWTGIPSCLDSVGQHLNYSTGTHTFSCGTTNNLTLPLSIANGGTATGSTLTGVVRGGNPLSASELSGDCTTSGSNAIICTKTNGVSFAASATTDTTNASNLSSGTVNANRFPSNQTLRQIQATFDGQGSALSGTTTRCTLVSYGGTIQSATVTADVSGSATIDVKTVAYSSYTGPASASSITASATPAISSAVKSQDSTLIGWTTTVTANTQFCFVLSGPATVTWIQATLKVAAN